MPYSLATISDVALGYGSSQIFNFSGYLAEKLKINGKIFEPVVPSRPAIIQRHPRLSSEVFGTSYHPYSHAGRSEYLHLCAEAINHEKPPIILIPNYQILPILKLLNYPPKKVIHLVLEDLELALKDSYGVPRSYSFSQLGKAVDVWLFPEENRAEYDAKALKISHSKIGIFFNVSKQNHLWLDPKKRNGRVVYAGTLDDDHSVGNIIFDVEMAGLPIDVFGDLQGTLNSKKLMRAKLETLNRTARKKMKLQWHGHVPIKNLDAILPSFCYSLVYWRPVRFALRNAAPNKFFQSIAAGVPVITAPHPQPASLIQRYGCGLVLKSWDRTQCILGIHKAMEIYRTSLYDEMVANCHHAMQTELSWERQIENFETRFHPDKW